MKKIIKKDCKGERIFRLTHKNGEISWVSWDIEPLLKLAGADTYQEIPGRIPRGFALGRTKYDYSEGKDRTWHGGGDCSDFINEVGENDPILSEYEGWYHWREGMQS